MPESPFSHAVIVDGAAPPAPVTPEEVMDDQPLAIEPPRPPAELKTGQVYAGRASFELVFIEELVPDPDQPRKTFTDLYELAENLKELGMLQPITARVDRDGKKIIMFGERRWRAAQLAGWDRVPVIIRRDVPDSDVLANQITENSGAMRRSLNLIEEARGIRAYMRKKKLATHAEAAKKLGHPQPWVSNRLALLDLDEEDQQRVINGELSLMNGAKLAREQTGRTRRPSSEVQATRPGYVETPHPMSYAYETPEAHGLDTTDKPLGRDTVTGAGSSGIVASGVIGSPLANGSRPLPIQQGQLTAADWFSDMHPVAGRARGRCQLKHVRKKTLPGGVACAECWEVAIRRDERLNPTGDAG